MVLGKSPDFAEILLAPEMYRVGCLCLCVRIQHLRIDNDRLENDPQDLA